MPRTVGEEVRNDRGKAGQLFARVEKSDRALVSECPSLRQFAFELFLGLTICRWATFCLQEVFGIVLQKCLNDRDVVMNKFDGTIDFYLEQYWLRFRKHRLSSDPF